MRTHPQYGPCRGLSLPDQLKFLIFKSAADLQICRVSKLFAKHFKIEEQSKDLQSRCVNIATGTPHRMGKLVELESLKLDRMKLLILDAALDAKQR